MRCAVLGLAFFFDADFRQVPTDAKPQTHCLAGVARREGLCVALRAPAVKRSGCGPSSCRSCMPCKIIIRLHGSSSPLVSADIAARPDGTLAT